VNDSVVSHVAALILHVAGQQSEPYGTFVEDLEELLRRTFKIQFSSELVDHALSKLEETGAVERMPSEFAGDLIQISLNTAFDYYGEDAQVPSQSTSVDYDRRYEAANSHLLPVKAYYFGRDKWVERVVANFASSDIPEITPVSDDVADLIAPAADRFVSLNDNQRTQIDNAAEELSTQLSKENSIDGDADLRSRFLAQIAASRELIRGESIRIFLVYETLVRMLGTLIQKYKGQAIGETAKKLLGLLIDNIFKAS
jgi:hypothetical protein